MRETTERDEPVGVIEHYYPKIGVAVVNVRNAAIHRGDVIRIVGHGVDLEQTIQSIQRDHQAIDEAQQGQHVGIRVLTRVHENDQVFRVRQ